MKKIILIALLLGCGPTKIDRWVVNGCISVCSAHHELDYIAYHSVYDIYCICGDGSYQKLEANKINN